MIRTAFVRYRDNNTLSKSKTVTNLQVAAKWIKGIEGHTCYLCSFLTKTYVSWSSI